jgi:hypothetical protein
MLNVMAPAMGSGDLIAALKSGAEPPELERLRNESYNAVGPTLPEKLGLH